MKYNVSVAPGSADVIPTPLASDAARVSSVLWHNTQGNPSMKAMVPPPGRAGAQNALLYDENNYIAMRIATALKRAGAPFALSVMEKLDFSPPDTAEVHVDCRANGYLSCYVGDDAPEVAKAAGESIFRVTFNVAAMRAEFRAAVEAAKNAPTRPVVAGVPTIEVA